MIEGLIVGILEQGLIYGIMAMGVYITYTILDFPDLSVDGTFPLGIAICFVMINNGLNPWLALLGGICRRVHSRYVYGNFQRKTQNTQSSLRYSYYDGSLFDKLRNSRKSVGFPKYGYNDYFLTDSFSFRKRSLCIVL